MLRNTEESSGFSTKDPFLEPPPAAPLPEEDNSENDCHKNGNEAEEIMVSAKVYNQRAQKLLPGTTSRM